MVKSGEGKPRPDAPTAGAESSRQRTHLSKAAQELTVLDTLPNYSASARRNSNIIFAKK
jgi:hypothetical protein